MHADILAIGNEGFRVEIDGFVVFLDAFYHAAPWVGAAPAFRAKDFDRADLVLVTHAHADHFHEGEVRSLLERTGARAAGPQPVIDRLQGRVDAGRLIEMEPPEPAAGAAAAGLTAVAGRARITAFRTFHARNHNSYLVEVAGFRLFHDGDNEQTQRLNREALGRIDALFIGPWQGSGWPEFVEAVNPGHWLAMHLTAQELGEHARGEFFPGLCAKVPERLVALRPGERIHMGGAS